MSALHAVFLGAPGAGKGTQARVIAARAGLVHISTGDMLRESRRQGTELGRKAEDFMNRGQLVPDEIMVAMVRERIGQPDAAFGWILDGFPRTLPQARSLDESLASQSGVGRDLSHAVYFEVPRDVLVRRLTGRRSCPRCSSIFHVEFKPPKVEGVCDECGSDLVQRADDSEDVVSERLETYRTQTEPLLDYYRARGIFVQLDGDRPPEVIENELAERLAHEGGSATA